MKPSMMAKSGTATTRRYIRRNHGVATERTATLVLTSPKGHFVDIRALKESGQSATPPLPTVSRELVESARSSAKLDWAFGGKATTAERADGAQDCAWIHLVDSKTTAVKDEVDEGVMQLRRELGVDGAEYGWEVESGHSIGADGSKQTYEEGWLSLPTTLHATSPYKIHDESSVIINAAAEASDADCDCTVLTTEALLEDPNTYPFGMIVQVGEWCQGVLRKSADEFYASRWWKVRGCWERLFETPDAGNGDAEGLDRIIQWIASDRQSNLPEWKGSKFVVKE